MVPLSVGDKQAYACWKLLIHYFYPRTILQLNCLPKAAVDSEAKILKLFKIFDRSLQTWLEAHTHSVPYSGFTTSRITIVNTMRKEQWQNVVREMPMGMTKSVNTMAVHEKVIYIYTCFNGVAIKNGLTFIKLW